MQWEDLKRLPAAAASPAARLVITCDVEACHGCTREIVSASDSPSSFQLSKALVVPFIIRILLR